MVATKPGSGAARVGTHRHGTFQFTIGANGALVVNPGDTISKYALALYGDAQKGWEEFGRLQGGNLVPLSDVNKIYGKETLYHIPTYKKNAPTGKTTASTATILDGVQLQRFFNSVAWRMALTRSAQLKWHDQKGSLLKSIGVDLYNLSIGKLIDPLPQPILQPPQAEVQTASTADIRQAAAKLRAEYWQKFLTKGEQGPGQATAYLTLLDQQRNDATQQLNWLYSEAQAINKGIENEILRSLKFLARTKLVTDVAGTVIGLTPGAFVAKTAISLGFAGVQYYIQTQAASTDAQASASRQLVVAVSQAGADVGEKGTAKVASKFLEASGTYQAEANQIAADLSRANQTTADRMAKSFSLDHKMNLAGQNAAKHSYWKGGALVLKGAGLTLAGYAIYLNYQDYKQAIGEK